MDLPLGVAFVDDEPLARRGVRRLVSSQAGFRVVGEAETGSEARALIERERPDVVPLEQELAFLREYLALEPVRFGDRLAVTVGCAACTGASYGRVSNRDRRMVAARPGSGPAP